MTDDAPLPLSRKLAYLRDICNIQMTGLRKLGTHEPRHLGSAHYDMAYYIQRAEDSIGNRVSIRPFTKYPDEWHTNPTVSNVSNKDGDPQ